MAFFIVESPVGVKTRINGARFQVVEADDAATARSMASGVQESDSTWSDASADDVTASSASDFLGFAYRARVTSPAGVDVVDVTHVGIGPDSVDDVGAALVLLLNATSPIAAASYAANVLTVAAISDALGDHSVTVTVTPPNAFAPVPQLVGAIVDEGIVAAVLTAALPAPTAIPKVIKLITE